jgi:hypothetical protein
VPRRSTAVSVGVAVGDVWLQLLVFALLEPVGHTKGVGLIVSAFLADTSGGLFCWFCKSKIAGLPELLAARYRRGMMNKISMSWDQG